MVCKVLDQRIRQAASQFQLQLVDYHSFSAEKQTERFEQSLRYMFVVTPRPGSACYDQMRKRWDDCAAGLPWDSTVTPEISAQLEVRA